MALPSIVFMDTSYAIAWLSRQDQYHLQAGILAHALAKEQTRLMTTQAVFLELGAAFAKPAIRAIAVRFIAAFNQEPRFAVVPMTDWRFAQALALLPVGLTKPESPKPRATLRFCPPYKSTDGP